MDTTHGLDLAPLATLRRAVDAPGTAEAAWALVGAGVPVLPCAQASSRPLSGNGLRGSSTDPDRVSWWWSRYPTANLAIPTGSRSGLDAVEVQPKPGAGSGFDAIRRVMHAGLVPAPGLMVATPVGGLLLFFPSSPDTAQASWETRHLGIRFHGEGGYVPLPPSLVLRPDGVVARYRLVGSGNATTAPVAAAALRSSLNTPERQASGVPRAQVLADLPSPARPEPVRLPARARSTAPIAIGGVRPEFHPDSGGTDRRPPEVVSL